MAKNKTIATELSVADYLANIADAQKRADCTALAEMIAAHTALPCKMWGAGIVGFGTYSYKYESGHSGSAPLVAFAARATSIVLYLGANFENRDALLAQFGKHKTGKGCVYIQKLTDIDTDILLKMVENSIVCTASGNH